MAEAINALFSTKAETPPPVLSENEKADVEEQKNTARAPKRTLREEVRESDLIIVIVVVCSISCVLLLGCFVGCI